MEAGNRGSKRKGNKEEEKVRTRLEIQARVN